MTDLATLGVRIDTSGAEQAPALFDKTTKAAEGTERAVLTLGGRAIGASKQVGEFNAELQKAYGISEKLTEGESAVIRALEDQINFLTLTREQQAELNAIRLSGTKTDSEAAIVIRSLAAAYSRLAQTQKALADQRAATSQREFAEQLAGPQSGKSARDSASVFLEDFERIDTEMRRVSENAEREFERLNEIARQKAAQIGATFAEELNARLVNDGIGKSARDSATVFSQELEKIDSIARQKAVQIGMSFAEDLNKRLVNDGVRKSAKDSAAVFSEELEKIDAIARQKAAQIGSNFGIELDKRLIAGIKKSAKDSADVFTEEFAKLDEIAKARAAQDGANFQADLNERLGITSGFSTRNVKSAADSAAVFAAADPNLLKRDFRDLVQIMQFSSGPIGAFARGIGNIGFGLSRFGTGVIAGVSGFAALAAAAYKATQSYKQFEDQQNLVNNRLAFTGGASGQNTSSIEVLVQRSARFGQNTAAELRDAAAELLKFRLAASETFEGALDLANRFSATGLMNVTEAARLMGQAFKNPVEGVQQLRDAGFSLSPVLEDNIRKFWEMGRTVDAQRALYSALASQLGGVTAGHGLTGSLTQLSESSNKFFSKFGEYTTDALGLTDEIRRLANVIDFFTGAMERAQNSNGLSWFFRSIAAAAGNTRPLANALAKVAQQQRNQGPQNVNDILGDPTKYGPALKAQQDMLRGFQSLDQAIIRNGQFAKERQDRIDAVSNALKEETRIAGMNSLQQRIFQEQQKAGVLGNKKEEDSIASLVTRIEGLRFARETLDDLQRRRGESDIELRTVNMTAEAADRYRIVQERLNEARIRGINFSPDVIAGWDKEAAAIARANQAAREAQMLRDLRFERDQLGRTDIEQKIAAAQRQAGNIDPNSTSGQLIANQVRLNEELRRSRELVTDFTSTFTSEFRSAISNGENFWKAFGDAGVKAVQRVLDKLADMMLQDAMLKAFGGFNFFGGFGGGSSAGSSIGGLAFSANGNIFTPSGIMRFADGAAFTNSILTRPTIFPFANGIGMAGEAGPEAIMPLRRLPSGRLGVEANGDSRSSGDIVQITVNVEGANGDQHVISLVNEGVRRGLEGYEKGRSKRHEYGGKY